MILSRHDLWKQELQRLVEEEIERLKDELASGVLKTLEEYRHVSGKIIGLRQSLDYIDEASSAVEKRLGA